VGKRVSTVLGVGFALWVFGSLLLGNSSGGVFLNSTPVIGDPSASYQANQLPKCVSAHRVDSREWGSLQTIRSDVWVSGCNDASGQLHLSAPPKCEATSFLGQGSATCTASQEGSSVKVVVHVVYPFGLDFIAGQPTTTSFTVSPSGNYSSP
jgi:hypothetical protein